MTREQRSKLAALRTELDRGNPSAPEVEASRQTRRFFDQLGRKAFVLEAFDVTKVVPPKAEHTDPVDVSCCNRREFQALLEMLSAAQRQDAVQKFRTRKASRRGDAPDASTVDGGTS